MLKISIPKPCHQDWNEMLPQQQGRFCNSCAKTVVDFTLMNDEEVKNYFIKNVGEKTCGRFINTQVHRITIDLPENILHIPMPYWKRFLTASLIIFSTTLFSCDTNHDKLIGLITPNNTTQLVDTIPVKNDLSEVVGKIKMPDSIPVKKICTQTMGIVLRPIELMGDVAMVPIKKDTISKEKPEPIIGTSVLIAPKVIKGKLVPEKTDTPKIKRDTFELVGEVKIDSAKIPVKPKPDPCDKNIYQ